MSVERCGVVYPGTRPYEGGSAPMCEKVDGHDGQHVVLLGIHPETEDYDEQPEWADWSPS